MVITVRSLDDDLARPALDEPDDAGRARARAARRRPRDRACAATCSPATSASSSPTERAREQLDGAPGRAAGASRRRRCGPASSASTRDLHAYIADYTEPLIARPRRATRSRRRPRARRAWTRCAASSPRSAAPRPRSPAGAATSRQALRQRMLVLAAGGAGISALLLLALGFGLRRMVLLPVRRVAAAAERALARPARHPRPRQRLRRDRPARRLVQHDGRGAQRPRARPQRPDRPPAVDPRLHDHDDLGQGPRRPLPAGQRRVAARDGPGRRRRHRPHRRRALRARDRRRDPRHRPRHPAQRRGRRVRARRRHRRAARSSSSSSRSRTPPATSTPPARWAPTSASASAPWPRPSRPRARSPSSWPT